MLNYQFDPFNRITLDETNVSQTLKEAIRKFKEVNK